MSKELFLILISAGLTSGWWAVSMFATGDGKQLFFLCAVASILGTLAFLADHENE